MNAFVDYHFGDTAKQLVPYVEGSVGKFFGYEDGDPMYVSAGPGLKWFFANGGGAINAFAFYRRQFLDADINNGASSMNDVGLSIGVAIYFGR
jgi:hypothetical protein